MQEIFQPRSTEVSSGAWRYFKLSVNICSQTSYLTMLTATTLQKLFLWLSYHDLLLLHTRQTKHKRGRQSASGLIHYIFLKLVFFCSANFSFWYSKLLNTFLFDVVGLLCSCNPTLFRILSCIWSCFTSSWADPDLARLGLGKPWNCPQGAGTHYRACSQCDLTLDQWKTIHGCLVLILAP